MIDSIKLRTYFDVDRADLIMMNSKDPVTFNAGTDKEKTCYYYRLDNDPQQPRIQYTPETRKAIINIPSIPNYYNGSSLIPLNDKDVPLFLNKLKDYVEKGINAKNVTHPSQWEIMKADFYYDFDVGDKVQSYIKALKSITIPGYKIGCYASETVFWRTRSKEIRFYDKHQQCIDMGADLFSINKSKGILRFEVSGVTGQELRSNFRSHLLGTIFDSRICNSLTVNYLNKCNAHNLTITAISDIYKALEEKYTSPRALTLMGYLISKCNGIEYDLNRITEYKYRQDIKALSLMPVIHSERLPPLVIKPAMTEILNQSQQI